MLEFKLLLIYILTHLVKDVVLQSQPQITRNILPSIKRVGETGMLVCTVARQDNNVVNWKHPIEGKMRTLTADDEVTFEDQFNGVIDGLRKYDVYKRTSGDTNMYTLVIRRLQLNDRGNYTCQVHVKGLEVHPFKNGEMIVLIPPSILLRDTDTTHRAREGDNVTLSCNADGNPTPLIKWVRPNGKSLPAPYNTFSHIGKKLHLQNITREGRGVYRCIADNHVVPTASQDVTLYTSFQPFAKPVQSTYGQAQNLLFDITLECRVSGYPPPTLQWYQVLSGNYNNLKAINDDERHIVHVLISYGQTLSMDEFWFQLTIINVQGNDYGEYICEGTNSYGVHRATVALYETSECQGAYCYLSVGTDVRQSSTAAATCHHHTLYILGLLLISIGFVRWI